MKRKVEWMCYITYFVLCLSLLDIVSKKIGLSLGNILICCFGSMLLYLLVWNIIFGVGHLLSSIYYCGKGLGASPVLLYPFVFLADPKRPVQLFWNFFHMCDYYYPPQIFINQKNGGSNLVSKIYQDAESVNFIGELLLCVVCSGIFFVKGYLGIGLAGVLLMVTLILLGNLKTDTYHGYFVRRRYMRQGYVAMYLARWCILYSNENHVFYKEFERIIEEDLLQEDFQYFSLETIKHMYMIRCVNHQFIYPLRITDKIPGMCFLKNIDEYSQPDIGDEKFSLMKAYLCYCVFSKSVSEKNILRYYLQQLANGESNSIISFNIFQWYLQMLETGKEPEQDSTFAKNTVLRRNQFLESFSNYKNVYWQITNNMK